MRTRSSKPEAAHNFGVMAGKLGLSTVPAAWPTGLSQLAQVYEACRRCEAGEVCTDWLNRTSDSIQMPPEFCPNAAELTRMTRARLRR